MEMLYPKKNNVLYCAQDVIFAFVKAISHN